MSVWTQFWDMHSGGGLKEAPLARIYIEAPEDEAKAIFYARFGHNPERVSCTCCGDDYSISEGTLAQISAYHRGCAFDKAAGEYVEQQSPESYRGKYRTVEEYEKDEEVLFIRAADIRPEWRGVVVPEQGYVWRD